jgi:transposase
LHILGYIRIVFADESGFTMTPYVPYAWQQSNNKTLFTPKNNKKRLNVLGFLDPENNLRVFHTEENIDSQFVINSIDSFSKEVKAVPVVIILDNAPIHKSKVFKEQMSRWADNDVFIFFLPRYSPHLNRIEILWKFVKYYWLQRKDYASWKKLTKAIIAIFEGYATKYIINFNELKNTG